MKFTLSWLHDHLDTNATLEEITHALTMVGLEVEGVDDPTSKLSGFEVAEILETAPHPEADRLQICTVRSGTQTQKLVCGASNARAGLIGILANEGAVIPANGMVLGKAKIRGVESAGMMCSAAELELSDDHEGIIELAAPPAIGTPAAEALGLDDPVIEIAITPNRPDCLGVRGIARDLAAFGLGTLKPDPTTPPEMTGACPIDIRVETKACPTFAGACVTGCTNGDSPDWLQRRLTAIGLRPINALVDITNYISFDRGRPLHVYDADKLTGPVMARDGQAGARFVTLDDREIETDKADCVITDANGVLGLGGVMGGLASGSTSETRNVLVESAWFDPIAIAGAGRRHDIDSDARYRFERGVDPQSVVPGLQQAVGLILKVCGGTASEMTLAGTPPAGTKTVAFDPAETQRLTGLEISEARMTEILTGLGFTIAHGSPWQVTSPSWRPDIDGAADIVEEITRIYGLDKVPSVALPRAKGVARPILTDAQLRLSAARRALAARGLTEAVTWSFISAAQAEKFGVADGLELANPISSELSHMRPSLIPGLVAAAARNQARGQRDIALFEVGQAFSGAQPGDQAMHASGVRCGALIERHWQQGAQKMGSAVDVFLARADAEAVLAHLGIDPQGLRVRATDSQGGAPAWYHPGRSGVLARDPRTPLAYFGELHPALLPFFDIDAPIVAFEVFPENLPARKKKALGASRPALAASNLQPVRRDFAFEVSAETEAQNLLRAAAGADKKLIEGVALFDVFAGAGVAEGMKSLAIEVTLQPRDATLTDAEIDAVAEKVIAAVEKATGGRLRG